MPIYEYQCSQCSKVSEVLQKVSDPAPETCPACGATKTLSKMLSQTSFVLKGNGWYVTDFKNKKAAPTSSSSQSSSHEPSKESSKTEEVKPSTTSGAASD